MKERLPFCIVCGEKKDLTDHPGAGCRDKIELKLCTAWKRKGHSTFIRWVKEMAKSGRGTLQSRASVYLAIRKDAMHATRTQSARRS